MSSSPQTVSDTSGVSNNCAIEVKGVTVAYRSYTQRPGSFKESLFRFIRTGQIKSYQTFDALSEISFQVKRGTVFGIIGSNGSGKSTLLKVLAQVLKPTAGVVRVAGSVASLIELGVGFDPELNAIENIYLNGSLYKKSAAQIRNRVDHILEFAELKGFATTPIKYYSSGMAARLGFAVAIDIDPEILLVDEILAVGDERFQEKCGHVFQQLVTSGKTIVIVSHNLNLIESTAQSTLLLSRGKMAFMGPSKTAVERYRDEAYRTALET